MKWIVGLDLRKDSLGAIAMSAWLHEHGTTPDHHTFVGVHVVDEPLRVALRDDEVDEVLGKAEAHAREILTKQGVADAFDKVDAVTGVSAEDTLQAGCTFHHAEGIVIGRHGPMKQPSLVRLGRVARRLLRALPAPVMVVPPDLTKKDIGGGPIVAATDLSANALGACKYARRLADSLSRKLTLVNVVPAPGNLELGYLTDRVTPLREPDLAEQRARTEQWIESHALRVDDLEITTGSVIGRLEAAANERDAPVLVCGSRRLSIAERMYQSSIGSTLAGGSYCAVALVPTPDS